MKFVSAAYGAEYRCMATGLARSFRRYMPDHELFMFGDGPVFGTQVVYLPIDRHAGIGHLEMSIKVSSVAAVADHFDDDVCWIDCDQLVLTDLSKVLIPGKLNVIGYGIDGAQRKIGNGKQVAQADYVLSGLFSMPPRISAEYRSQSTGGTKNAEGYDKLLEQELVNRLVVQFADDAHRVDHGSDMIWSFVGDGHPVPTNKTFCSMRIDAGGTWSIGARQVGVVAFTSDALRAHVATSFSAFNQETQHELLKLYLQR